MHVLPNGHAVYCAWNTDNGGPQRPSAVQNTFKGLRSKYPAAKVFASTFEQFYAAAAADPATMAALPVVTQEIGDTCAGTPGQITLSFETMSAHMFNRRCCALQGCTAARPIR